MINPLYQLRIVFERALLTWLQSSVQQPISGQKRDAIETLNRCLQTLAQGDAQEFYWQHSQTILENLLQDKLADQTPCRKVFAKINLLLAAKEPDHPIISSQLWHDTLKLESTLRLPPTLITTNDNFLQNAEQCLQHLTDIQENIGETPQIKTEEIIKRVQAIHSLAIANHFGLLTILAKVLENLFATRQQQSLSAVDYMALHTVQKSMRGLLHQVAAGIAPKCDETFLTALSACAQAENYAPKPTSL